MGIGIRQMGGDGKERNNMRWRRILNMPVVIFLLIYHFSLSIYLYIIKQIRKTVMFPGG